MKERNENVSDRVYCPAHTQGRAHLDVNLLPRDVERVRHTVLLALAGRCRSGKLDAARVVEVEGESRERMLNDEHADQTGVPNADRRFG